MNFDDSSFENRITKLFHIKYPIIQAGMIWAAGWRLVSAVSNAGGLGLLGAGSMYPEILEEHIKKCKQATEKPFGVNLPLIYPDIGKHVATIIREKVPIVFSSAGNPKTWTEKLKDAGITVVHVVSSAHFAAKSQAAGVDAVVAEGFEAGGHNGREETTTLCLIPKVREAIDIPLIAAGGIGSGRTMFAMMALGAEGVQMGTRFVCSPEASSHENYKKEVLQSDEGGTAFVCKKLMPVRMMKTKFYEKVAQAESEGWSKEQLAELLGHRRPKKGMFDGDLENGELQIGQVSAQISSLKPAAQIVADTWKEFCEALEHPFYKEKEK